MDNFKDHALLLAARDIQQRARNLVIYSRLVKAIVEVSWIVKPDGQPLKATGLKEWLRSRGLFLECLCPLVRELPLREPCSCRLVESNSSGDVFAFCNLESDGCGMNVNISNIVETTQAFSSYSHFPTIKGSAPAECEPMATILGLYHERGYPNFTVAPHLEGYIGEHVTFYQPGAKQLAGMPRSIGGIYAVRKFQPRAKSALQVDKPLPKSLGKRRYIEVDEFDNPSSNPLSATEAASFITPFGKKSSALTRRRKNPFTANPVTTGAGQAGITGPSQGAIAGSLPTAATGPLPTIAAGSHSTAGPSQAGAAGPAQATLTGPPMATSVGPPQLPAIASTAVTAAGVTVPSSIVVAAPQPAAGPAQVPVAGPSQVPVAGPSQTPIAGPSQAPVAGSSHSSPISISSESEDGAETSTTEIEAMLERLLDGQGLTGHEWVTLTPFCTNCGLFFLRTIMDAHKASCIDEDWDLL